MLYIRISLMKPRHGKELQVAEVMDDLVAYYATRAGYVAGYKVADAVSTGEVGRITVWKSEAEADAAAQSDHVLARRSALIPLIEDDSHSERTFFAEAESNLLARLIHTLKR